MAYFAKIIEGKVATVIAVNNSVLGEPEKTFPDTEEIGANFINHVLRLDGEWRQTSYNSSFRKNYAGKGFLFDREKDAFIPLQPFASWVLDEQTCRWMAPVPYPADGKHYLWDEETTSWKEITI